MNEQQALDSLIQTIIKDGVKPRLLLHCCCAPCASYVLEYLSPYFDITAFYFNPNITDKEEYDKRLAELTKLAAHFGSKLIDGGYSPDKFFAVAKGLEAAPEGGARCAVCFALRLTETATLARGYDYFATTLTISPLKNAKLINSVGLTAAKEAGANYLPTDFKKRGGYQRSIVLCRELELYRQNYCGCEFSKR